MRGPGQWTAAVNDWNTKVIAEFRANAGTVGGAAAGEPLLLLRTVGARTGIVRITPVIYLADETGLYVFASKDGAATHPDWFHNIARNENVVVELASEVFSAVARPLAEPRRSEIFATAAARFPRLAVNEKATSRVIPVLEIVRVPADITAEGP